jgi:hypothetical protein
MKSNYVIWKAPIEEKACSLSPLVGWPDNFKLQKGERCLAEFPKTAQFKMNPKYPKAVQLRDSLRNSDWVIVVSQGLRNLIDSLKMEHVEFVPVPILDHKNNPIGASYFIANPLEAVDCLVIDQCDVSWSGIVKTNIDTLEKFVIDESKIAADRLLFRAKYYDAILVHRKLAAQIDAAKLTGVRWVELENYPEN